MYPEKLKVIAQQVQLQQQQEQVRLLHQEKLEREQQIRTQVSADTSQHPPSCGDAPAAPVPAGFPLGCAGWRSTRGQGGSVKGLAPVGGWGGQSAGVRELQGVCAEGSPLTGGLQLIFGDARTARCRLQGWDGQQASLPGRSSRTAGPGAFIPRGGERKRERGTAASSVVWVLQRCFPAGALPAASWGSSA